MVRGELAEKTVLEHRSQEHRGANLKAFWGERVRWGSRCKGPGVGAARCVNGTAKRPVWPAVPRAEEIRLVMRPDHKGSAGHCSAFDFYPE